MFTKLIERMIERSPSRTYKAAAVTVRQRLAARETLSREEIVARCSISGEHQSSARRLLASLGDVVGVPCGNFRPDDRFADVFSVQLEPSYIVGRERAAVDANPPLQVFAYEIFGMLLENSDRTKWNEAAKQVFPQIGNEDEWVEEIMGMKLCNFLAAFAPLVRPAD